MADNPTQTGEVIRASSARVAETAREHFQRGLRLVEQARLTAAREARSAAFAAAAGEFERALQMEANYAGARTNLGYCLIELGRLGDAKREIQQAIKEFPGDASAMINYAVILQHNRQSDEAQQYLRRAIQADPKQAMAYRDLAYLLERQGRYRAAADNLERYLELEPHTNDERAMRWRIQVLRDRAGFFELPDRITTPAGLTADLRKRAAALALDAALMFLWWQLSTLLIHRFAEWAPYKLLVFTWLAYFSHLLCVELAGGTLGKIMLNTRVVSQREDAWFSPGGVRETLKLAPLLLSLLIPFPGNLILMAGFAAAAFSSALGHRSGRAWYDRAAGTDVVDWDYGRSRFVAWVVFALLLLGAVWLKVSESG